MEIGLNSKSRVHLDWFSNENKRTLFYFFPSQTRFFKRKVLLWETWKCSISSKDASWHISLDKNSYRWTINSLRTLIVSPLEVFLKCLWSRKMITQKSFTEAFSTTSLCAECILWSSKMQKASGWQVFFSFNFYFWR